MIEVLLFFYQEVLQDEMTSREVASYGAIEGTAVKTKSAFVGDGAVGKKVLWTSRKGICLGENGGVFTNLTATQIPSDPKPIWCRSI